MLPAELTPQHFANYPTQARMLVQTHLGLLQVLPVAFLPSLLQEVIDYDYRFPAERAEVNGQLSVMSALPPRQLQTLLSGFAGIRIAPGQIQIDWVNQPQRFTEWFSAYLWSTHQMDAFRRAADDFSKGLQMKLPAQSSPLACLGIVVIGQGVKGSRETLFQKLRPMGLLFNNVDPENGLRRLLAVVEQRAKAYPAPYAHWYVDGGVSVPCHASVCQVSYAALSPLRDTLMTKIQQQVSVPGMGPERLRDYLANLTPEELGLTRDPVLDRFQLKVFTEGSGTQIYSTTFAQWAAREVLRRAAPVTLLVRFAPRQRQRSMSELIATPQQTDLDPEGSLVDADMAAFYHWVNQQRLPGSERSSFVAWFEGQGQAVILGPTVPRGVTSSSSRDLTDLVALATA